MILTHESGSQEDQFDEKKWRQKISWDYPFKTESFRIYKKLFMARSVCISSFDFLKFIPFFWSHIF